MDDEPVVKYELSKLVRGIRDDNRHEPTDWGEPVGREREGWCAEYETES